MVKQNTNYRILMFPWLAHGHIFPFLELSRKLTTRNFTVYLCSTPINLDSIKSTIDDDASINLVELQIPPSSELPPQHHTTKNLPSDLLPTLLRVFQTSSASFSDIIDSVKPDLLIYDFFQPWAPKIASSKGVPSVYFSTSSATTFSFYHHAHTTGSASTFPFKAISVPEEEMNRMKNRIASNLKDVDDDFAFGILTRSTDILLIKSCRDVEAKYIDYLSGLCNKQLVCTGPLIADANVRDDDEDSLTIIKWLDGKNNDSTIYISFGSECFLSKEQIAEVAEALLRLSDVNFLWIIRSPIEEKMSSLEEQLPEGFLEKVKERGLVVSNWAPQTKILGHRSIAGFVSHCGWSSVTESIYFGVPIITMPIKSEQPINAQLAVEAGVGVAVKREGNGVYMGDEVAKAIKKVMMEKTLDEGLRSRVRRMSEKIKEKEEDDINEVAEQLLKVCIKYKNHV